MFHPLEILQKAKHSGFYLNLLNWGLGRLVPFNKPHGIKVKEIGDDYLKILLPYKRKNLNHIRGLHACGLATVSEFASGLLMLSKLDQKKYRIIMQRLEMDYHYQGKMDAVATFELDDDFLQQHVMVPLQQSNAIVIVCEVKTHDASGNHLSTGKVHWQIKDWSKVKTKIVE